MEEDHLFSTIIGWVKNNPGMTILLLVLAYRMCDQCFYREPVIAGSRVSQINTKDQFEEEVKKRKFVVVNYTANWCPACRSAGPSFATLSTQFVSGDVAFIKVNVDVGKDLTDGIKSIPTFKVFSDGKEIAQFVGYNEKGIREALGSDRKEQ